MLAIQYHLRRQLNKSINRNWVGTTFISTFSGATVQNGHQIHASWPMVLLQGGGTLEERLIERNQITGERPCGNIGNPPPFKIKSPCSQQLLPHSPARKHASPQTKNQQGQCPSIKVPEIKQKKEHFSQLMIILPLCQFIN